MKKQGRFWCKVGDGCGSELKSAHHVEIEKGLEISTLLVSNGFRQLFPNLGFLKFLYKKCW